MAELRPTIDELVRSGRFEQAALRLAAADRDLDDTLRLCELWTATGQMDRAIETLDALRAEAEADTLPRVLGALGAAWSRKRSPDAGKQAIALLLDALGAEPDVVTEGLAHLHLGATYLRESDATHALEHLLLARQRLDGDRERLARVFDAIGGYWTGAGDSVRALSYLEHSLALKEQTGDLYGQAITHGRLGRLQLLLGDLESARAHLEADLELARTIGDAPGEAMSLTHLAKIAVQKGQAADGLARLDEAERARTSTGIGRAFANLDRGAALTELGDHEAARDALAAAGQAFRDAGDRYGEAHVLQVRARLSAAQEGWAAEAVKTLLAEAVDAFRQAGARLELLAVFRDQARHHTAASNPDAAIRVTQQALSLAEACRADAWVSRFERQLQDLDERVWLQHMLAKVHDLRGVESGGYALRSESRFVALIFTDIVGFTRWSSTRSADVVVDMLNQYFSQMSEPIERFGGRIDKYIGDGLMVRFDDDRADDDLVLAACRCGLAMRALLEDFNRYRSETGSQELDIRIGIHAGTAVVGNIGSYSRVSRTAIGRTVNIAARLESVSAQLESPVPRGRILVSPAVTEHVGPAMRFQSAGAVPIKGIGTMETWWLLDETA